MVDGEANTNRRHKSRFGFAVNSMPSDKRFQWNNEKHRQYYKTLIITSNVLYIDYTVLFICLCKWVDNSTFVEMFSRMNVLLARWYDSTSSNELARRKSITAHWLRNLITEPEFGAIKPVVDRACKASLGLIMQLPEPSPRSSGVKPSERPRSLGRQNEFQHELARRKLITAHWLRNLITSPSSETNQSLTELRGVTRAQGATS